jgi:hypothetical protein
VSWSTARAAVLGGGRRVLIDDPPRFEGVATAGVDEHVWRHTRHGDKYVTVVIDLMTHNTLSTNPADTLWPVSIPTRCAACSSGPFPNAVRASAAVFSAGP